MPVWSTWESSITSPVLISFAALRTVFGPIRLPAPRSSPAPHLDGQRALSGGTVQLGVWAMADVAANAAAATMIDPAMCPVRFMTSSHDGSGSSRSSGKGCATEMVRSRRDCGLCADLTIPRHGHDPHHKIRQPIRTVEAPLASRRCCHFGELFRRGGEPCDL